MANRPGLLHYIRDVGLARDLRGVSSPNLTTSSGLRVVDARKNAFLSLAFSASSKETNQVFKSPNVTRCSRSIRLSNAVPYEAVQPWNEVLTSALTPLF